jgi:hypothetical protein
VCPRTFRLYLSPTELFFVGQDFAGGETKGAIQDRGGNRKPCSVRYYTELPSFVSDLPPTCRGLERQIESGTFTLTGEKKALADISASKRARKAVEQFQVEQDAIDAERARAEELRKELASILSVLS